MTHISFSRAVYLLEHPEHICRIWHANIPADACPVIPLGWPERITRDGDKNVQSPVIGTGQVHGRAAAAPDAMGIDRYQQGMLKALTYLLPKLHDGAVIRLAHRCQPLRRDGKYDSGEQSLVLDNLWRGHGQFFHTIPCQ